jgi:hypothetical protein
MRDLLGLRARHNREFGEQAAGWAPAFTGRWINVTTATAHPYIFHRRHLHSAENSIAMSPGRHGLKTQPQKVK